MQLGGIVNKKATTNIWYTDLTKKESPIKRMIKKKPTEESDDEEDIKEGVEEWKGDNFVWRKHKLKLPFAARAVKVAYTFDRKVIVIFIRRSAGKGETFILDTGIVFIIMYCCVHVHWKTC